MKNLLIEQRGPTGLLKTWRLRPEQVSATFGNSRHADLRSPSDSVKGIQGIFEYRDDGKWYFINLETQVDSDAGVELAIEEPMQMQLAGASILFITPYDARTPLLVTLAKGDVSTPGQDRTPYQFFAVFHGSTLLETKVVPINKKFVSQHDPSRTKFVPEKTSEWKRVRVGDLEIAQATVYLTDEEEFRRIHPTHYIDKGGKKSMIASLIGCLLLAILFFLMPKNASEHKIENVQPLAFKDVSLPQPPKKKKAESAPQEVKVAEQAPPQPNEQDKKQKSGPAPKVVQGQQGAASKIKNLATGRISALIGKVSAQAAKSANVVVASGVTAGSQPSGRALSAVGKVGKSGKDWATEGKGSGIVVSTQGKAGGKGTGGVGNLAAGKTGSGGVGLLEEEGEIVGGLDREIIAQYIRSQLGQILYCYERQLSANPDLYGKVAVKFTISGDGSVETQRVGESTLRNATVEGCILQKVARWKFPAPEGGTKVLVTYPFLFKSTN